MNANDFFIGSDTSLLKYSGETYLAKATLNRLEREYSNCLSNSLNARKYLSKTAYKDSLAICKAYIFDVYMHLKNWQSSDAALKQSFAQKIDSCLQLMKDNNSILKQDLYSDLLFCISPKIFDDSASFLHKSILEEAEENCRKNGAIFFIPNFHLGFYFERKERDFLTAKYYYSKIFDLLNTEKKLPQLQKELCIQFLTDLLIGDGDYDGALYSNSKDVLSHPVFDGIATKTAEMITPSRLLKSKCYYAIGKRADIFLARYKKKGFKTSDLDHAIQFYTLVDQLLFPSIISSENEAVLRYLSEVGASVYENAVEAAYYLYGTKGENNKTAGLKLAFGFLEHRKAFLLYKSLHNYSRTDLDAEERKIVQGIASCNSEIEILYGGNVASNSQQIDKIILERASLHQKIKNTRPDFFSDSTFIHPLDDVCQFLSSNHAALIHYSLSDTCLFILYLGNEIEKARFFKINIFRDSITARVEDFRHLISSDSCRKMDRIAYKKLYESYSKKLYDVLLGPIIRDLPMDTKQLVISPDGQLSFLPFAALLAPGDQALWDGMDCRQAPFLLKRWNIVYTPAWKIFRNSDKPTQIKLDKKDNLLAMSYGLANDKAFLGQALSFAKHFDHSLLGPIEKKILILPKFVRAFESAEPKP